MSQFNYPSNNMTQALDAIITLNSGSSEPPATSPYMLWMDTSKTPAVMRQRNADDTAWIDLFASMASKVGVPVGTVNALATAQVPDGWLKCDGSEVSRSQYADLFAAVGEIYGVGDGITTFKLPDLRGEFIRGLDDGRGVDASRVLGSFQADAGRNVSGSFNANRLYVMPGLNVTGAFYSDGSNPHNSQCASTDSSNRPGIGIDASRVWGAEHTADEFRSRNVALMYVIKY